MAGLRNLPWIVEIEQSKGFLVINVPPSDALVVPIHPGLEKTL